MAVRMGELILLKMLSQLFEITIVILFDLKIGIYFFFLVGDEMEVVNKNITSQNGIII